MNTPESVLVTDGSQRVTQGVIRDGRMVLYENRQYRRVQRQVVKDHLFEGRHLEHALRRARRWLRKPRRGRPPGHIAVFLAVLRKVEAGRELGVVPR